jgi:surfeit locus 1 family protein
MAKMPMILIFILAAFLASLGFWQLQRADQKRDILKERQTRLQNPAVSLNKIDNPKIAALRYQNADAVGHYDNAHQILIDNQIVDGKVGYYVLTPLKLNESHKAVLVNRGWLPLPSDRAQLPDLTLNTAARAVRGRLNRFPSVGLKLAGAEIPSPSWPTIVQVVDSAVLAKKLGYALCDFQLELDKNQPDGFKREWHAGKIMLPEQHVTYAFQWFGLAFTVIVLFFRFRLKK